MFLLAAASALRGLAHSMQSLPLQSLTAQHTATVGKDDNL
ncbi:Hypothetical protein CpMEX30_1661 [Corynebacterium pseudotuberculosis]|nr:Hypothetical protein CpE19_1594 [Corynebacterium pseudotuberculosis]APG82297.1 Hypothetical protein CPI37_1661 [Corynebacterium pseudotuberculosis]APQ54678.1 Hypothetical protein CpMEX30_1661 [Corynebacterium pseudotuberculosis]APQ56757.1 Hypothetical protein CpMEX31_1650 [Corynebacterium pseudotuberculosis]ATB62553.1 Hypothetical protein BFF96_1679 [Corynebacterium pseudotuberculosis]